MVGTDRSVDGHFGANDLRKKGKLSKTTQRDTFTFTIQPLWRKRLAELIGRNAQRLIALDRPIANSDTFFLGQSAACIYIDADFCFGQTHERKALGYLVT